MRFLQILFVIGLVLFVIPSLASAATPAIWSCDSSAQVKNTIYTNESVYLCARNITADAAASVRIYIMEDTSSWPDNKTLSDVTTGYREVSTNGTGDLPPTAIWSSPSAGSYDIAVDIDKDGIYNTTRDFVDNASAIGVKVEQAPVPTLTVSVGSNSTTGTVSVDLADHSGKVTMMQAKIVVNNIDDVTINGFGLIGSGSGKDHMAVHYAELISDTNGNGVRDTGERLLGYGSYLTDDSFLSFTITEDIKITASSTNYYLIVYHLVAAECAVDDTFSFQLASINAVGTSSGEPATVSGLPKSSATIKVTGIPGGTTTTLETTTTTVTNETTTTTSTTAPEATTTSTQPPGKGGVLGGITNLIRNIKTKLGKGPYITVIIIIIATVVIIYVVNILLKRMRHREKPLYVYGPARY